MDTWMVWGISCPSNFHFIFKGIFFKYVWDILIKERFLFFLGWWNYSPPDPWEVKIKTFFSRKLFLLFFLLICLYFHNTVFKSYLLSPKILLLTIFTRLYMNIKRCDIDFFLNFPFGKIVSPFRGQCIWRFLECGLFIASCNFFRVWLFKSLAATPLEVSRGTWGGESQIW